MKKLLIMLCFLGVVAGASAQKFGRVPTYRYTRPQVIVGLGAYAPLYPYYGLGYGYGPFSPFAGSYGYAPRPSRLGLKIEDISNDYQDRIWSVKHDKSLSRRERRQKVHELKHERDMAITDAKRNYYKY